MLRPVGFHYGALSARRDATRQRHMLPAGVRQELVQSRRRSGSTWLRFNGHFEEGRSQRSLRSNGNDAAPGGSLAPKSSFENLVQTPRKLSVCPVKAHLLGSIR